MRIDRLKDELREPIKEGEKVSIYIPSIFQGLHIKANDRHLVIALTDPLIKAFLSEYPKEFVENIVENIVDLLLEQERLDYILVYNPRKGVIKIRARATREVATAIRNAIIECWSCESDRTNEGR